MMLGPRRMIAGFLAWVGKVTLLFTLSLAAISLAAHALLWFKTGKWPSTFVLGEPFGEALQNIGLGTPSSSWTTVQAFLNWTLNQPTWMIAFVSGIGFGLLLMTWGDTMERNIRFELRHRTLTRDRRRRDE
jgi:hypothetical protein